MNLFIDTHLLDVAIILFDDSYNIVKKEIISDVKQNSTIIMPLIEKILEGNNPSSIVVVNGPGSFTGVRLGVTIAKTFAYTLNIPIRVISSLECLAVSLESKMKTVAFSDNNGYYVGNFDENNKQIEDFKYLNNIEYEEYKKHHSVVDNINIDFNKIIKHTKGLTPVNPHSANPIYIKKIDVEK